MARTLKGNPKPWQLCARCHVKYRQDGKFCRDCAALEGATVDPKQAERDRIARAQARLDALRKPEPPRVIVERTFRDPLTGHVQTFEVVFP